MHQNIMECKNPGHFEKQNARHTCERFIFQNTLCYFFHDTLFARRPSGIMEKI